MPGRVRIDTLPEELTLDDAIEVAYGDDLAAIEQNLRRGLSVLVECDKQITLYLYRNLRERLKRPSGSSQPMQMKLLAGRNREGERGGSVMGNVLSELAEAVASAEPGTVVVMPHLDILTTTTKSGLGLEAREAIARFYENPEAILLGFKDPSFEIPKVIEDVYTARRSIIGMPRDRLPHLVLRKEARKFEVEEFDPFSLYKYVSGVNAVKLRHILANFESRLDFDPANPGTRDALFREIREMTLIGDMEIPRIDLMHDIGGYQKVKDKIESEILSLLRQKDLLTSHDEIKAIEGLIPRGIIFSGPPGTGKTFFAKAIATSIDATCIVVAGPELKSKWYGESEENLRRLFMRARKSAPAIIVFDEIDSFATARGLYANTSGVDHSLVNQLLTEMDGFRKDELVFVIGTTNFVESLDPALLRPGRFEFQIDIPYPNEDDRKAILEIYRKKFALDCPDPTLEHLVRKTGALIDVEKQTRWAGDHLQALMRALKREEIRRGGPGKFTVTIDEADKALGGKGVKRTFTPEEEKVVAFHESGHALCSMLLPNASKVEKITIATGDEDTLGYVLREVRKNKYVNTRAELLDDVAVLLGGRTAERMRCGDVSVGAYDDLRKASEIARVMVEELGMADTLDPRTFGNFNQQPGQERRQLSPERAKLIDDAIDKILREAQAKVDKILQENGGLLDRIAGTLLEKKQLTKEEVAQIVADWKTGTATIVKTG